MEMFSNAYHRLDVFAKCLLNCNLMDLVSLYAIWVHATMHSKDQTRDRWDGAKHAGIIVAAISRTVLHMKTSANDRDDVRVSTCVHDGVRRIVETSTITNVE